MLNPYDVVSQARDKKKENLEWIMKETELRQALGVVEPRMKSSRVGFLGKAIEIVKSLILLKWPALDHK